MYIIAEIGSNYNSIEDCVRSIELAKEAGADAVKFQHYTMQDLYGIGKQTCTPIEWLHGLNRVAKQMEIDFSCTFFEPAKLQSNLDLLDFIKIASSNMMDFRLLDIARTSGKKTLISTGGHELHEVQRVYEYFPEASYLYCESAYPSYVNDYDKMRNFYFEGISDHSLELFPSYPVGTRFVEKHVNLIGINDRPDSGHALDFLQFSRYCRKIRDRSRPSPLLSIEEVDMRTKYNVRLVATKDIGQGCTFTWDNVGIFRGIKDGQKYINPMDSVSVIGNIANKEIKAWSAIGSRDIQTAQSQTEQVHT